MQTLSFDRSESAEGVTTLEAMVSTTSAPVHAVALAEAQQLLDWAWREFPHGHGPADDGNDWDHDLQVGVEPGGWQVLTLTLTASPRFLEAFDARFGGMPD